MGEQSRQEGKKRISGFLGREISSGGEQESRGEGRSCSHTLGQEEMGQGGQSTLLCLILGWFSLSLSCFGVLWGCTEHSSMSWLPFLPQPQNPAHWQRGLPWAAFPTIPPHSTEPWAKPDFGAVCSCQTPQNQQVLDGAVWGTTSPVLSFGLCFWGGCC